MTTPTMRLLEWATALGPAVERDLTRALTIAQNAHRGRFRFSGDPCIDHPVAVALILVDHGADPETVVAGVLHSLRHAVEAPSLDALRADVGSTVSDLVREYVQLSHTGTTTVAARDADERMLQIVVACWLHDMRTIRYCRPSSQRRQSDSALHFVAPLARTIGMAEIGDELDELAVATLRAHDAVAAPSAAGRSVTRRPVGVRSLHRALHVGALLLPAHCRHRWVQDWDGELHAASTFTERLGFAASVLIAMPSLAVTTRQRTGPPC